jgi:hypothetical protein
MNPFEPYGIKHLSASALNAFSGSPALYVMERLLKRSAPVGCAAHRGNACEDGITAFITGQVSTIEEARAVALKSFDRLAALSGDPKRETERDAIPDIVAQGIGALRDYGPPSACQVAITHQFEGVAVPMIGFADFVWSNHGIVVDLKTTMRLSSEIKTNHARQVALYKAGISDNYSARIAYVTPKKSAVYELEDARQHLAAMRNIALALQRFLALSTDPHVLAGFVAPDIDSFYFSDPRARQAAFEVFGV